MNWHFTKQISQMDNKYSERCLISLAFREMNIKTINPRTAIMKKKKKLSMSGVHKVGDPWNSHTLFGMVN